jgi:predicted TIM-barrel fold metal-dependent hydrolase
LRIDSHHSFSGRYPLEHLETILKRNRFDGSVLVTRALGEGSAFPDFVRGIVVVADLGDPQLPYLLDEWQRHPKFRGVCHHFAGAIPDGLAELERRAIPLDAVAAPALLPCMVDRFPALRIALDHVGHCGADPLVRAGPPGPAILAGQEADEGVGRGPGGPPHNNLGYGPGDTDRPGGLSHQWAHDLAHAAQFPQVFCKLSAVSRLIPSPRPYVQHALAVFGPRRLMFGSDWPACLPEATWKASLAAFTQAIGAQSIEVREELLGGTAERFYAL